MSGHPRLRLHEREVHVWLAFPDRITDTELLRSYLDLLSLGERARLQRLRFERHRHERLISRALVRTTLSRYADVEARDWVFERNEHGRPAPAAGQYELPLQFNLSHTTSLVACAVTLDREIGVDVEDLERPRTTMDIADHYFAPAEVRALRALPAREQCLRFFEYWTLKESYIKARGMGLALPLRKFSFELGPDQPIRISFESGLDDDPGSWQFASFRPDPRHVLAVGVRRGNGPDLEIRVHETVPLREPMDG